MLDKLDTIGIAAIVALLIYRAPAIVKEVQVIFNNVMDTISKQQAATLEVYKTQITRILDTNDQRYDDLRKDNAIIAESQKMLVQVAAEERELFLKQFENLQQIIHANNLTMGKVLLAIEAQQILSSQLLELKKVELGKMGHADFPPKLEIPGETH